MALIHLPHDAVGFLNALYRKTPPSEGATKAVATLVLSARRWLDFYSGYTLDEPEANKLGNLRYLWDDVERAVNAPSPTLDAVASPLYKAVHAMDQIRRQRERAGFSQHLALNDLLLAGAALVKGRGTESAVAERLPTVEQWLDNVAAMLAGSAPRLQPQVTTAVQTGIDTMRRALGEMRDAATLAAGIARAHAADEIVSQFLDWERRDHERLAEQRSKYDIPIVGPELELGLEGARRVERRLWRRPVQDALDLFFPRLERWWAEQRPIVLMPAETRPALLQEVDMALFELRTAIAGLLDASVGADTVLARYEAAIGRASEAFGAVREARFDPAPFEGTTNGVYFDAIQGVLNVTVPDMALLALMHEHPLPDSHLDVRDAMLGYLEQGDTDLLLSACAMLMAHVRSAPSPFVCPSCGGTLSAEGKCDACGHTPISVSSWEA